ncbi:DUF1449 domain-containing protein [Streptomyces sp. DSM 44915]|uniref:DUF1449 domain-containing protein n=1 Tax=Streptomyces chisholmiae TaxID=3075540 RepID=A0ABU2JSE8_9ACTN|nr:DUF1449 domain-containing protein [Streptomyces sp. DSM 44915]MDT0267910.1 DUF1449 domain-containing protein [Streptomyces sp. DSM 44915]
MAEFFSTTLEFPAVVFTIPFAVVLLYWLFALAFGVGAGAVDAADGGADAGSGAGSGWFGLGGVPLTVSLSLLIALAWFAAMAGGELIGDGVGRALVPPAALLLGWAGSWLAVRPLRRLFQAEPGLYHQHFVGRVCEVRTSRVTTSFGQAEVTADDGGTAIVQIRAEGPEAAELASGRRALIYSYEPDGGFFWVAPYDAGPVEPGPDESGPGRNRALD